MITWDRCDFSGPNLESANAILELHPTLAANVANGAVRSIEVSDEQALETNLGSFAASRLLSPSLTVAGEPAGVPKFKETLDILEPALARQYRNDRLSFCQVDEADVAMAVDQKLMIFNRLLRRAQRSEFMMPDGDLEFKRDSLSEYAASIMRDPDDRKALMKAVMEEADRRSRNVKRRLDRGDVTYEHVIKGGGVHAANLAVTLHEADPDGSILIIDDGEDGSQLGGQFAKYGRIPTFQMNSRIKTVNGVSDIYGLPGGPGDLNSLGLHAILRLDQFVPSDLATNVDMADCVAVNMVLSGADIVFGAGSSEGPAIGPDGIVRQGIFIDTALNEIIARAGIIDAGGVGLPELDFIDKPYSNVLSPADMLRWYGAHQPGNRHKAEQLAGKWIGLVGCGDTAKVIAKLVLHRGPTAAYNGLALGRTRPAGVVWISDELADKRTKNDWKANVRSQYADLGPYFPDGRGGFNLIEPTVGRENFNAIQPRPSATNPDALVLQVRNGDAVSSVPGMDWVVRSTGLRDPASFSTKELRISNTTVDRLGVPYSRQLLGILAAGPTCRLGVRNDAGVPENTASIWSTSAATTLVGYRQARRARRLR